MKLMIRSTIAASLVLAGTLPCFAQSDYVPTVENGGLIPAGLIVWLLPVSAVLTAALLAFVDRKLRSGKISV